MDTWERKPVNDGLAFLMCPIFCAKIYGSFAIVGVGFFESYSITVFRAILMFGGYNSCFWACEISLMPVVHFLIR
jgi:hypothetical protein